MLIRSQDKRIIINLQNTACIEIEPNFSEKERWFIVANFPGKTSREIVAYPTEEKAIKVLDMIQDMYLSRMELDGGFDIVNGCYVQPNYWVLPKVFEMPQDEEV